MLYALIAWSDYFDGIAARVTGQYSRLGALLDPLVDRLLIIAGIVVCWHFELLPRWALAILAARELFMLVLARYAMSTHVELRINWLGRWGVWPVFSAIFFALCNVDWLALACLYVGLVLVIGSTVQYVRDGLRQARAARLYLSLTNAMLAVPSRRPEERTRFQMDTFPDLGSLSDQELKDLIQQLTDEEQEVSYRRRILHGKIDILRAELVNRLRKKHEGGEEVISGADVQRLTDILAGRATGGGEDI